MQGARELKREIEKTQPPQADREGTVGLPLPPGSRDRQTIEIICGDAADVVRDLPVVQAVVTSPPYFGQRIYGGSECEVGREQRT